MIFNNTLIDRLIFNGISIDKVMFNGEIVEDFGVDELLYSVGLLSDIHITTETDTAQSETDFTRALQYFSEQNVKMACASGDLTEMGTDAEFVKYKEIRESATIPMYETTGNHEASSGRTYKASITDENCIAYHLYNLIDRDLYYCLYGDTYEGLKLSLVDGVLTLETRTLATNLGLSDNDVYIFVGILGDANNGLFFQEGLQWFKNKLELYRNKRCFIFEHCRAENLRWDTSTSSYVEDLYAPYVSGNISGKYLKPLWGQADNSGTPNYARVFETLMSHYTNCTWFHGHTHQSARLAEVYESDIAIVDKHFGDMYSAWTPSRSEQNTKYSYSVHVSSFSHYNTELLESLGFARKDAFESLRRLIYTHIEVGS